METPNDFDYRIRRMLVVANETIEAPQLEQVIRRKAARGPLNVLVVAPALNSRLRHRMSDEDDARRQAEHRLVWCLRRLTVTGIEAEGVVGDADPLQAIADALHTFEADEIVISTHPAGRSHWLSRDIVQRARLRFGLPVVHVVCELTPEFEAEPPGSKRTRRRGRILAVPFLVPGERGRSS